MPSLYFVSDQMIYLLEVCAVCHILLDKNRDKYKLIIFEQTTGNKPNEMFMTKYIFISFTIDNLLRSQYINIL